MTGPLSDGKGPSAALIKATLINSARALTGLHKFIRSDGTLTTSPVDSVSNPRHLYGFGRPVLNNTLAFAASDVRLLAFDRHVLSAKGEAHRFKVSVESAGSLKATLVYTDPPGPVTNAFDATPVLVNDLDLMATCEENSDPACQEFASDKTWKSNSRVDNVEQVPSIGLAPNTFASSTTITIEVKAVSILQAQPYSLVISGSGL